MVAHRSRALRPFPFAAAALASLAWGCSDSTSPPPDAGESIAPVTDCALPVDPATGTVTVQADITYSSPGGVAQRLDVATPVSHAAPLPWLVLVHGGAWTSGDKGEFATDLPRLAALGYAVASINYRLASSGSNTFPAAISDVRCALRYLRENAAGFGARPDGVLLLGTSAGGHLASLAAVARNNAGLDDGSCPAFISIPATGLPTIAGVVSFYGPEDLRHSSDYNFGGAGLLGNFLGATPEQDPSKAAAASPITYVSDDDPPFLFVHGTADPVVRNEQSHRMSTALRRNGVTATVIDVEGAGHGFRPFDAAPLYRTGACTTLAFLAARRTLSP